MDATTSIFHLLSVALPIAAHCLHHRIKPPLTITALSLKVTPPAVQLVATVSKMLASSFMDPYQNMILTRMKYKPGGLVRQVKQKLKKKISLLKFTHSRNDFVRHTFMA